MVCPSRREVLSASIGAVGLSLAGCLGDSSEEWETGDTIPATSATLYMGPNCDCCDRYATYFDDSIQAKLETVVIDDIRAIKPEYGIEDDLQSCHTVELDNYVLEGHLPAQIVATLVEEQPDITGIALPGMPAGTPGMGGAKSETWTVYEIDSSGEPAVYREL